MVTIPTTRVLFHTNLRHTNNLVLSAALPYAVAFSVYPGVCNRCDRRRGGAPRASAAATPFAQTQSAQLATQGVHQFFHGFPQVIHRAGSHGFDAATSTVQNAPGDNTQSTQLTGPPASAGTAGPSARGECGIAACVRSGLRCQFSGGRCVRCKVSSEPPDGWKTAEHAKDCRRPEANDRESRMSKKGSYGRHLICQCHSLYKIWISNGI